MFLPDEVIKEIADRTDIEQLIGRYVTLQRAGSRLKGLCPFHHEKTPSFTVSPDKGVFHCFGCKKGGNAFTFLMEMEKMTFPEAAEYLAKEAGISLEEYKNTGSWQGTSERQQITELYDKVAASLHYILLSTPQGKPALDYLLGRGVTQEMIEKFKLGYMPADRAWLYNFLVKKHYTPDFLAKTGLFSVRYPKISIFSGRVIYPVFSKHGNVIAFGGRTMKKDEQPKYINSPETTVFKKHEELYGLNYAMLPMRKLGFCYIVEGYMDVIAMHQAGIENVVAPLGTALTETQAAIIKRNAPRVVLLFDGDAAGVKAAERGTFICEKEGLICDIVKLPGDNDPQEILKKNGAEALHNCLKYPINCFDFILENCLRNLDLSRSQGIMALYSRIFPLIDLTDSEVRKEQRLKALADKINADYRSVYNDYNKRKGGTGQDSNSVTAVQENRISSELFLLLAVMANSNYFELVRNELSADDFYDSRARDLFITMEECFRNGVFSEDVILSHLENEKLKEIIIQKLSSDEFKMNPESIIKDSIRNVQMNNLVIKRLRVERMIRRAASEQDTVPEDLIADKRFYDDEIEKLKGMRS